MNRRELIKLASAAAVAQSLPRSLLGAPLGENPFALGIASGSPRHDSVVLWTRLIAAEGAFDGKPIAVDWEIAHDEQFRRIVQKGSAPALPQFGHSIHVELSDLQPDHWYFYRFHTQGHDSHVGRTRTFPAPGSAAAKMRLAYASCQRWEHGYYAAWRHMQDEELDAVFFVGDYIYEYGKNKKDVRSHTLGKPVDLAGYRARYALYKSDENLQGMHARCPWLLTWDDHEVINDYAGLQAPGLPAEFPAQRAAAYQAYYENMPLRASVLSHALQGATQVGAGAEMRLCDRASFGDLADFHILDNRQYRSLQACSKDGLGGGSTVRADTCTALHESGRSLLGAEQEKWLDAGLQAAGSQPPRWTVLVQATLFGLRESHGKTVTVSNDAWDGYPDNRQRIVDSLVRCKSANPVMLGGDVHSNWVGHIKSNYADPHSANVGVEFCGTSISSNHNNPEHIPALVAQNPHFIFGDGYRRGYGVVELTPKHLTTKLRVVSDVTKPDAGIETLASFAVEAGRSVVEKL
ncbi:MAG: alkaline phosphatase [Rhodocyclales bacterium]|nr:alkaline phosphatase [Rhodocyclales bacterium]